MEATGCRLDPMLRAPGRRRLPHRPRTPRERRERRVTGLLSAVGYALSALVELAEMIVDVLLDLVKSLLERLWRELRRIFHGRCRSGRWDSEAGLFALTVFRHHWLQQRALLRTMRIVPAPGGVLVELPADENRHFFACALRRKAPPRRQRRRLDLVFADGSWVALEMPSPDAAAALRHSLAPGSEPRHPYANGSKSS